MDTGRTDGTSEGRRVAGNADTANTEVTTTRMLVRELSNALLASSVAAIAAKSDTEASAKSIRREHLTNQ
jgi:hypothetical protein